jgi:lipopolysaccharide export system permease protein
LSIIDRYIATSWLRIFVLCEGCFLTVYLLVDYIERFRRFTRLGAPATAVFKFFFFKIPEMVGQTTQFAVLMATILTLGLLSRTGEITALRSSGVSLLRISAPLLVLGVVISGILLINAEIIIPASYQQMDHIEKVVIEKKSSNSFFRLNNIWFRTNNYMLQAKVFDPISVKLNGVVVWELTQFMEPIRRFDAECAVKSTQGWTLVAVTSRTFKEKMTLQKLNSLHVPLALNIDDLRVLGANSDNLSFRKLRSYAHSIQQGGYNASRYLTLMHTKLSSPFGAFVMVVLGIPFAIKSCRTNDFSLGIVASVCLGFAFFLVNSHLNAYGRSGVLPPIIGAWGGNFLFLISGVWLSMTRKHE